MHIRVVFVIMLISSIAFYAMAFRVPVVSNLPALIILQGSSTLTFP